MLAVIKEYVKRSIKSSRVKWLVAFTFAVALLMLIFTERCKVTEDYLKILIPTVLVNILIILYGCSQKASSLCMSGLCLLNVCAAVARASFGGANNVGIEIYVFMLLGVLAAFVVAVVHRLSKNAVSWQWVLSAIVTIGALFLCLAMPEVNGARNWLDLGLFSVQLTEVAKFFYVFFIGILFSSNFSDGVKLIISGFVTFVCAFVLLICNELGTILIMCGAYACVLMIMLESKKMKTGVVAVLIGVCLLVAGFYLNVDSHMGRWSCESVDCQVENLAKDEICSGCKMEKPKAGETFKCPFCKYTTWKDIEIKTSSEGQIDLRGSCPHCNDVLLLKGGIGNVVKKVYNRFTVTYKFEEVKGSAHTYQIEQCHSAMKVGGLFGDMNTIVNVPSATVDTDSVVATLTNRVGLIFVGIILLAFFLVFMSICTAYSPLRIMALCTFVFQAVITYLGTLNLMPATGVGVPLISRGGTNLIISYLLIYLILSSAKNVERRGRQ